MRGLGVALALSLLLGACAKDGEKQSTSVPISGNTITQAPCSILVIIAGQLTRVTGDRNSTVTVGNTTITFDPNCSSTTTTTEPHA